MQNGLAIIEKTDTETKGFYIDQDALEFARMNARTEKRISKAEAANREADRQNRKAEKIAAQRKAYTWKTVGCILADCAVLGAVTWAGTVGMVHPIIYIPVSIFFLCVACVRFGVWFGRVAK